MLQNIKIFVKSTVAVAVAFQLLQLLLNRAFLLIFIMILSFFGPGATVALPIAFRPKLLQFDCSSKFTIAFTIAHGPTRRTRDT